MNSRGVCRKIEAVGGDYVHLASGIKRGELVGRAAGSGLEAFVGSFKPR